MLTPGKYALTMTAGTDFDFAFRYKIDGDALPLAGSLRMQVRKRAGQPAVLDLANDGALTGPRIEGPDADGWYVALAPASVTEEIPAGAYVYALEWTDQAGRVIRLLTDTVTVAPDLVEVPA